MPEVFGADLMEEVFGTGAHGVGDEEIGPEGGSGEEAGEDGVEPGGVEGGFAGELGRDDTEALAKLGQIPALAPEDANHGRLPVWTDRERVELAGDGLEERGLAAAVGTEDGEVFACMEVEADVVKHGRTAARDVHMLQGKDELRHALETA